MFKKIVAFLAWPYRQGSSWVEHNPPGRKIRLVIKSCQVRVDGEQLVFLDTDTSVLLDTFKITNKDYGSLNAVDKAKARVWIAVGLNMGLEQVNQFTRSQLNTYLKKMRLARKPAVAKKVAEIKAAEKRNKAAGKADKPVTISSPALKGHSLTPPITTLARGRGTESAVPA